MSTGLVIGEFDGRTYDAGWDEARLTGQLMRVYACVRDGRWRTLEEVSRATGDSVQSISARLRDFRKRKFGGHIVERRPRGDRSEGLFEYRIVLPGRPMTLI